jgi:transcriptional regulator GlxA family with amidase domain
MTLSDHAPFGSGQLLCACIEELLVRLIRRGDEAPVQPREQSRHTQSRVDQITAYLEQRLDQNLTVQQICRDNLIGRAQLEQAFHKSTGGGVIDYFNALKISAAKQLIRENKLNFTQIAAVLGFRSVHYFSRRFRLVMGMSPSEYAKSVKMLSDAPLQASDNRTNNM